MPNLEASPDFEAEMKSRSEKEHAEKAQRDADRAREQKTEKLIEQEKLAEQLAKPQSLDPEANKERRQEANFRANLNKIYPDRLEQYDKTDDALWRESITDEKPLPERAKLVDQFNSTLHKYILWSFALQGIGLGLFVLSAIISGLSFQLQGGFLAVELVFAIIAIIMLYRGGEACNHRIVPSDQEMTFKIASEMPSMAIRIALSVGLGTLLNRILFGNIIGMLIGLLLDSAVQHDMLNRYHIYSSFWIVIINTAIYCAIEGVYIFSSGSQLAIIEFVISFLAYFATDRLAYRMAKTTA